MGEYTSIKAEDKSSLRRLHWRVPGTIVGSLLLGILTAICHHCIYDALDGAIVSTDSEQRWIIRGGTALAFLFKMFLTIATGASYVQQLWLTVSKQPSRVDQIDGMFDMLKDAGGFVDIPLWIRNPLLLLTALVTWYVAQHT